MKVCYFSTYFFKDYIRQKVLLESLKENGVQVFECIEHGKNLLRYLKALFKYVKVQKKVDLTIVGFRGHEILPFVQLLTKKPVIFDSFVSGYQTIVLEKKLVNKESLIAKLIKATEKYFMGKCDKILVDTIEHKNYFVKEFGLEPQKVQYIYLTASKEYKPRNKTTKTFTVFWYGSALPMHGLKTIIGAAKELENERIEFKLIARMNNFNQFFSLPMNMTVIDYLPQKELIKEIGNASVCLTGYGDTHKSNKVILGKTWQYSAMEKTMILSDTKANKEVFKDQIDCLMVKPENQKELAKAIMFLKNNGSLARRIGKNSRKTFGKKKQETYKRLIQEVKTCRQK